jgi:hypothetical protein
VAGIVGSASGQRHRVASGTLCRRAAMRPAHGTLLTTCHQFSSWRRQLAEPGDQKSKFK